MGRFAVPSALQYCAELAALHEAALPAPDLYALRQFLRTGGLAALEALGAALFIYCLLFQRKMARRAA
jgi:hypothetical protein